MPLAVTVACFNMPGLRRECREFFFGTASERLTLRLTQVLGETQEYGLFVWPSALVLAEYLWENRALLHGKRVLEVIYFV